MVGKRLRVEAYALETPDTRLLQDHYEDIIDSLKTQEEINYNNQYAWEINALCDQVRERHAKYKEQKRICKSLRLQI
jgi:hypothetical protein